MHKVILLIIGGTINMETFATYILSEEDWVKKLEIAYYLKKKVNIFFNNTVIFKK